MQISCEICVISLLITLVKTMFRCIVDLVNNCLSLENVQNIGFRRFAGGCINGELKMNDYTDRFFLSFLAILIESFVFFSLLRMRQPRNPRKSSKYSLNSTENSLIRNYNLFNRIHFRPVPGIARRATSAVFK